MQCTAPGEMAARSWNSWDRPAFTRAWRRSRLRSRPSRPGRWKKTNEAYALAKISGLKYCEFLNRQYGTDYISVMPTNLYGPNDNYHPQAFACPSGHDPPFPRGEENKSAVCDLLGRRQRPARIPVCGRSCKSLCS